MSKAEIKLPPGWKQALASEFEQPYMHQLKDFLLAQRRGGKVIFPKPGQWFNALDSTDIDNVRVVILGQDPYPTPGHAHGLCFSVQPQVNPLPKSLQNIFAELADDLGIVNRNGCLQTWAAQGVLLLNSVLTVESGKPGSHQGKGWEAFTDTIVQILNQRDNPLVFVLWGAYAHKKGQFIDTDRHLIIRSSHPSPLSAYRGFFGSRPFSQINQFLQQHYHESINWQT